MNPETRIHTLQLYQMFERNKEYAEESDVKITIIEDNLLGGIYYDKRSRNI